MEHEGGAERACSNGKSSLDQLSSCLLVQQDTGRASCAAAVVDYRIRQLCPSIWSTEGKRLRYAVIICLFCLLSRLALFVCALSVRRSNGGRSNRTAKRTGSIIACILRLSFVNAS